MKSRRRRWLREETLAPWLTILVILGLWWGASSLIGPEAPPESLNSPANSSSAQSTPAAQPAGGSTDSERPTKDAVQTATVSPPDDVPQGVAIVPVAGMDTSSLTSTFHEERGGGTRRHEAMDILAPRGTPVVASVSGRIVKLFTSAAGGLTIYQFDEEERFCYYYAHLDGYAPELNEGQMVTRGQVIGYVGTTGNAPADTPHLHFAVYRLGPDKRWWDGEPIDPITMLR